MKQIKSFIGILIVLSILSSCSTSNKVTTNNFIQKRKYNKGYHLNFTGKVTKAESNVNSESAISNNQNPEPIIDLSENETNTVDKSLTEIDINITASIDKKQTILLEKEKTNLFEKQKVKTTNEEIKINPSIKSVLKKEIKTISINTDNASEMSGMALAGFILGILGLILVLLIGWPFLLGTLGTIFSAIGLGQTSKGKKGKGFAIVGLITSLLTIVIFWLWVALVGLLLV